jgi:hypothetical protein
MAGRLTENYKLLRLRPGDSFSTNGGQFLDQDRQTIDRELKALRSHRHNGIGSIEPDPVSPLGLTLLTTGGTLPAGTRVFYKYALVDIDGAETAASPEAYIDTPIGIIEPGAAALSATTTGGSLLAGTYYYAISAYSNANTFETRAPEVSSITLFSGSVNTITLTLPSLPAGADGFNVYRRKPGAYQFFYLTSIDMNQATPPSTFVDNGSIAEDCDRSTPVGNNTVSNNSVQITIPGATPTVPLGFTWKIYRTFVASNYAGSLLKWVVEETSEGSGVITNTYLDDGDAVVGGSPKSASQLQPPLSKVDLENGAEVNGRLPLSKVSGFPTAETFAFEGDTVVMSGTSVWVCPFPKARILSVTPALGRYYVPASTPLIVDVNKGSGLQPAYSTIFTTQANRPKIEVGNQLGIPAVPNIIELVAGDSLTLDIDQTGGGATPTDRDLTVTILMIAYGYTDPLSMVW